MAKKRRGRRSKIQKVRVQRDRQYDSKRKLLDSPAFRRVHRRPFRSPLDRKILFYDPSEDRRRWKPERSYQSYRTLSGAEALIGESTRRIYRRGLSWRVFVRPNRTLVCAKRAYRRAVLFSKGRIGQGKSVNQFKDRIMRQTSKISCKRR